MGNSVCIWHLVLDLAKQTSILVFIYGLLSHTVRAARPAYHMAHVSRLRRCALLVNVKSQFGVRLSRHFAVWHSSDVINDRKSKFQGHAIELKSETQVKECIDQLIGSNKKLAKASHTITALRVNEQGEIKEAFSNGGEPPAGGKMLELLRQEKIDHGLVVVHRWYGGKQLGGDRFRHILQCAREALERAKLIG